MRSSGGRSVICKVEHKSEVAGFRLLSLDIDDRSNHHLNRSLVFYERYSNHKNQDEIGDPFLFRHVDL